jgi:hypothetical protein
MAAGNEGNFFHWFDLLWVAAVTAFWKLFAAVNGKADKGDVDGKHIENRANFDKVLGTLGKIDDKVDKLSETVAVLADRAGMNTRGR